MRWLCGLCSLFMLFGAAAAEPTVLVLGDSLSAGYGLNTGTGWVALLQQRLRQEGYPHRVINASVTGETTAGGLSRLPAALDQHKPDIVLIELGGNDGLRGLPLAAMRDNLTRMVRASRRVGARPVLFEMRIPPNYGLSYTEQFARSFEQVARAENTPLVPFFLAEIALKPEFFQDDGIHPNESAQARMLAAVWPSLTATLKTHPKSAQGRMDLRSPTSSY